jgi:putative addiction module component (TIGR02574 family)
MSRSVEEIETELLQLDRHARAALAKTLLDSLETLTEAECEEVWIEEGEARFADFQAGRTKAVDGDEVFARARARRPALQLR